MKYTKYKSENIFVQPIFKSNTKHYLKNEFLYWIGYDIDKKIYFISDEIECNLLYTVHEKHLYNLEFSAESIKDFALIYYLYTQTKLEINYDNMWYRNYSNNLIIPESIHLQNFQDNIISKFLELDINIPDGYEFLSEHLKYLYWLDKNTINYDNEIINSNYFTYTNTGRPTNNFNKLNLMALSKKNNDREKLKPQNDILIEVDYSGFHLSILNILLKCGIDGNIHEHIGKQFFNVDKLTKQEYKDVKLLNFLYLYEDTPIEIQNEIQFFKKVEMFTDWLWKFALKHKFVYTHTSKRKIYLKDIKNKKTLLNYFLQAMEIELSLIVLKNLFKLLNEKKTKVILYTYDSFLLDVSNDEILLLNEILSIITHENKYPITIKQGTNYKNLTDYEHKFTV